LGTKQIKDLILELGRRGKTVLLSSHLLADVEDCVDRLVILYGGQKRAEGTCDELLVTQSRTSIEADTLDDATVAEIDQLIRARSEGAKSITKVSKPRQSLEALFIDIVERARAEINTSGATSGGETASFLKAEEATGSDLIEMLTAQPAAPAPVAASPTDVASAPSTGPDASLINNLIKPAAAPEARPVAYAAPTPSAAQVQPAQDIDTSLIGDLLGGSDGAKKPNQPGGGQP
jgi:ABC-2 type transport system ATP-binding protein